ncbi:MAG: hypothetical protein JXA54_08390 [Candidatus Heimdallarchaeota archaeon]|nr:hypothetical protein [Candidatus Heimdallarchaeota archaeon]
MLTIVSITNFSNSYYIPPLDDDPTDPGNSPGPGSPPELYNVEINPIFQLTMYDGIYLLSL